MSRTFVRVTGLAVTIPAAALAFSSLDAHAQSVSFINPSPVAHAGFGMRVASNGTTAAIGAPSDTLWDRPGRVQVYRRSGTGWDLDQTLVSPNGHDGDVFGEGLQMSAHQLFVAAPREHTTQQNAGVVYVYNLTGDGAEMVQRIQATPTLPAAMFGLDLAVSHDANTVVVGASQEINPSGFSAGAVYIFERNAAGVFAQVGRFLPPLGSSGFYYGRSIDIADDRIAIGAPGADGADWNGGAAYFLRRVDGVWRTDGMLLSPDPIPNSLSTFGQWVSFGGNRLAVCSLLPEPGGISGSVFLFERSGSNWTYIGSPVSSYVPSNAFYGYPCELSRDGSFLAVGAMDMLINGIPQGGVATFNLSSGVAVEATPIANPSGQQNSQFGGNLVLGHGGLWVGAGGTTVEGLPSVGAAYALQLFADSDLNHDGSVNAGDLTLMLAQWGSAGAAIVADINGDGFVDGLDLGVLLSAMN